MSIARALVHDPPVLIFDEATNGLDVLAARALLDTVSELRQQGKCIVFSTHIMQEVDALCDRVLILRGGRLVVDARLEALRRSNHLLLDTSMAPEDVTGAVGSLAGVVGVERAQARPGEKLPGGRYRITLAQDSDASALCAAIAAAVVNGGHQLYQLRGRVGRAKLRAYAYLTTKPRAKLTVAAEKRLKVLGSLDSLGAGFQLASQDLDIRGAGNLLGEEQSGHIKEVGFELYQSMLEETVASLREGGDEAEESGQWSPQINLGVPVMIPEGYIPDLDIRLGLYRRLSGLATKVELEGFAAELIDRFGPIPREVNTLMLIVRIKSMCKRAGISRIDAGVKGATVQFHNDKFANPAGLVEFMKAQGPAAKISGNKIVLMGEMKTEAERIKGAFAIARSDGPVRFNHPAVGVEQDFGWQSGQKDKATAPA